MKYRPPIDCNENREDPDEYFGCWHIILASTLFRRLCYVANRNLQD